MNEEYKCKDCKWLTGQKNIRGIECMNPKLQEKWNKAKTLWMGELRKDTARYKQRNAPACKKFEKEQERACEVCYYERFDSTEYPCSMCVNGEKREDLFRPKEYE